MHFLTQAASSQAWPSAPSAVAPVETAVTMSPLLTSLQEQTCASSGIAATPVPAPPRAAGRISSSGLAGSAMPLETIGRRIPYAVASPTRIPPRRRLPSSVTTSFL